MEHHCWEICVYNMYKGRQGYLQTAHGVLEEQCDGAVVSVGAAADGIVGQGGWQRRVVVDPQHRLIWRRVGAHPPVSGRKKVSLQACTRPRETVKKPL